MHILNKFINIKHDIATTTFLRKFKMPVRYFANMHNIMSFMHHVILCITRKSGHFCLWQENKVLKA